MYSDFRVTLPSVVSVAVQANLVLLAQGTELIGRLGQEIYVGRYKACFNSSMGGHFRHVVEHYQGLLGALETGDVDYEKRARDEMIETDPAYALQVVKEIEGGLKALSAEAAPDRTLRMAAETVADHMLVTSLGRELEFLISHTVHHYALIAVIAGHHGVALPDNFGMAPSTLKYLRTTKAACAR